MDRGQIHTLEAFIAALLIVGALLFASQATAVTPLSASTSNQHIENQQEQMADDLLSVTANNGKLKEGLLYWNTSTAGGDPHFSGSNLAIGHYTRSGLSEANPLHDQFNDTFGHRAIAYNMELRYVAEDGSFEDATMVEMGSPSANSVVATRTVTLFEDDYLTNQTIALSELDDDEFWGTQSEDSGPVYNVVEVRLTLWRM